MPSSASLADDGGSELAVVGFDTATEDTAVCAVAGSDVAYESLLGLSPEGRPRHSTALLEQAEQAASAVGGWDAVGTIAVGLGPGSFTGLRIGVATARALGTSLGLRPVGVCTLDAIGRALGEAGDGSSRVAVLDGRRGEVFAALYSGAGARLWEPLVCSPTELAARLAELAEPPLAGGSGAVRFRNELANRGIEVPDDADPVHRVAARHICALASVAADEDDGPLAPIYLRPPDAERWRERDSFQTAE